MVEKDELDLGLRNILNFGHTVGHAIESVSGLRIWHGEAVAIGMVAAGRASALVCGFAEEHRQHTAIVRLGLPVTAPAVDPARVRELMGADKKRAGGDLRMVLLADIGDPQVVVVDDATVTAALTAVGIGGPIR